MPIRRLSPSSRARSLARTHAEIIPRTQLRRARRRALGLGFGDNLGICCATFPLLLLLAHPSRCLRQYGAGKEPLYAYTEENRALISYFSIIRSCHGLYGGEYFSRRIFIPLFDARAMAADALTATDFAGTRAPRDIFRIEQRSPRTDRASRVASRVATTKMVVKT